MNEQELGQALRGVRAELSPSSIDKARLRDALGLSSGALGSLPGRANAGAAPHAQGPAAPSLLRAAPTLTRRAALLASGKLGIGVGALLFVGGLGMGLLWRGTGSAPVELGAQSSTSVAPAPVPVASQNAAAAPSAAARELEVQTGEAEPAPAPPAGAAPPAARRARTQPAAAAAASDAETPLSQELALLRRVERALRANDPALAVALLGELDARFPHTRLGEERQAARRMADCRQHEPDALLQARAFLSAHPASVYSERVQLACGLETEANDSPR